MPVSYTHLDVYKRQIPICETTEKTQWRSFEDINPHGHAPVPFDIPRHSGAEQPISVVEAGDPRHLRGQPIVDFMVEQQAVPALMLVRNQIRVVIEKIPLKNLCIESRFRRQVKIQADLPIKRILRDNSI